MRSGGRCQIATAVSVGWENDVITIQAIWTGRRAGRHCIHNNVTSDRARYNYYASEFRCDKSVLHSTTTLTIKQRSCAAIVAIFISLAFFKNCILCELSSIAADLVVAKFGVCAIICYKRKIKTKFKYFGDLTIINDPANMDFGIKRVEIVDRIRSCWCIFYVILLFFFCVCGNDAILSGFESQRGLFRGFQVKLKGDANLSSNDLKRIPASQKYPKGQITAVLLLMMPAKQMLIKQQNVSAIAAYRKQRVF